MTIELKDKDVLRSVIAVYRDNANASKVVAERFRPEFEACWHWENGKMGALLNGNRATELRQLVIENEHTAKFYNETADALQRILEALS